MSKWAGMRLAEAIVCCVVTALCLHQVPETFRVIQVYELSGNLGNSKLSSRLTKAVNDVFQAQSLDPLSRSQLRCRPEQGEFRYRCKTTIRRRSLADQASRFFKEMIPAHVGWIPQLQLRRRLARKQTEISVLEGELTLLSKELTDLEPEMKATEEAFRAALENKTEAKKELANREAQFELIRQALAEPRQGPEILRFQEKAEELETSIAAQKANLATISEQVMEMSRPFRRRDDIATRVPKLQGDISWGKTQVEAWTAILDRSGSAETIADPASFQLAAISGPDEVLAARSYAHLPWSLPLGLFFFAFWRGRALLRRSGRHFEDAEEVAQLTGLRHLGNL